MSQPEQSRHTFECQCRHSSTSCHRNIWMREIANVLRWIITIINVQTFVLQKNFNAHQSESSGIQVTHWTIKKQVIHYSNHQSQVEIILRYQKSKNQFWCKEKGMLIWSGPQPPSLACSAMKTEADPICDRGTQSLSLIKIISPLWDMVQRDNENSICSQNLYKLSPCK